MRAGSSIPPVMQDLKKYGADLDAEQKLLRKLTAIGETDSETEEHSGGLPSQGAQLHQVLVLTVCLWGPYPVFIWGVSLFLRHDVSIMKHLKRITLSLPAGKQSCLVQEPQWHCCAARSVISSPARHNPVFTSRRHQNSAVKGHS